MLKHFIAAGFAALALAQPAAAQSEYPNKTVRLVVPFAPGGSTDTLARIMAEQLQGELGQTVIVENKPGAGGNIGGDLVAKSPADGYTVLVSAAGMIVINPSLYASMPYDPLTDLAPVTLLASEHSLMAVPASLPIKSVKDLIAYAKSKPKDVSYGSPGNGTPAHLGGELFNQLAGTTLAHIPYKGSGPAINDLIAGQTTMMVDNMPALLPHVQSGRLRAIAVASEKRVATVPDVPTAIESGLKGYVITAWKGLMVPAGTPRAVIDKLHAAAVKVLAKPDVRKRLLDLGAEPAGTTPEQYAKQIKAETASWAALVKSTGTKMN